MIEPFAPLVGIAAPLPRANVDTETIIPLATLVASTRGRLGPHCLASWRVDAHGTPDPSFFVNDPRYRDARILVTGANFGCGSAREAAVWALWELGLRVVIAESFGDVFRANCFRNGLLPITLGRADVRRLTDEIVVAPEPSMCVNLATCRLTTPTRDTLAFSIEADRRDALLEGLDEVGMTSKRILDIRAFERRDRVARPWAYTGLGLKKLDDKGHEPARGR